MSHDYYTFLFTPGFGVWTFRHFVQINLDRRIEMSRTAGHYLLHNSFSSCACTILGPTTIHCVAVIDAAKN